MRVLAFDVSVSGCSVSILDTETLFSCKKRVETDRGQAEMLIPMIEQVGAELGIGLKEIDCIAVTQGPGSFTGVRIGLATARSLGLALDCPVFGFSTLDVIARSYKNDASTLFLIDTKRGDFYGQIGGGSTPRIWAEEEVSNHAGPIIKDIIPDIMVVAHMAAEKYQGQKGYDIAAAPAPIYLRGAEVSQPKNKSLYCFDEKTCGI